MRFNVQDFDKRRIAVGMLLGLCDEEIGLACNMPLLDVKLMVKGILKEKRMSRDEFVVNWNASLKYPKCEHQGKTLLALYENIELAA